MKSFLLVLFPVLIITLGSCYANPNADDLERVKSRFLLLRFQAPLTKEYKHLNDKDLFELSCSQNRVKCSLVLKMLEEKDPDFFSGLKSGGSRAAGK
jgi:hypothetical protein